VGLPDAAAVKVAADRGSTTRLVGCAVTAAGVPTVRAAAAVGVEPWLLVKTARYSLRSVASVAFATDSVSVVAPPSAVSLDQVCPPSVETCHCTVGSACPCRRR